MRRVTFAMILMLPAAGTLPEAGAQQTAAGRAADSPSQVTLCGPDEPGERLTFSGRVLDDKGQPIHKAAVLAYNADRNGLYNPPNSSTRIPRLRGVAITDENGRFRFTTVRPGPYPNGAEPAHVHLQVMAPAHHHRYVTYWFEGDPLITAERRRKMASDPELVIVELTRGADGAWVFSHDIALKDS